MAASTMAMGCTGPRLDIARPTTAFLWTVACHWPADGKGGVDATGMEAWVIQVERAPASPKHSCATFSSASLRVKRRGKYTTRYDLRVLYQRGWKECAVRENKASIICGADEREGGSAHLDAQQCEVPL